MTDNKPETAERFTDDEILGGISKAIAAGDMPAVADLLKMLAVQAPAKAQVIYDAVVLNKVTIELPFRPAGSGSSQGRN